MTFDLLLTERQSTLADLEDVLEGDPLPFHRALPGYRRTPLYDVPGLARSLGVARVLVKDESERLGLPAFKMLGASWATARAIQREWMPDSDDLTIDGLRRTLVGGSGRGLAAATDGNHGRGVARMAGLLGLECTIFVPAGTATARIRAIESEGAIVIVVDGTYDDAIERSAREARPDVLVISDTSWPGYTATPTDVIVGYSTMFREIDELLAERGEAQPDVVLLQSGVGSFAASGLRHYADPSREHRPTTVIVEPTRADCLLRSARAGELTEAPGPHESTMAGLNCGLPSLLAWPVVQSATDAFLSIDDDWAHRAMRLFAQVGIVAGESGAASLGGLLALHDQTDARRAVGLTPDATVLMINTEGATDPENYELQVGETPGAGASEAPRRRQATSTATL